MMGEFIPHAEHGGFLHPYPKVKSVLLRQSLRKRGGLRETSPVYEGLNSRPPHHLSVVTQETALRREDSNCYFSGKRLRNVELIEKCRKLYGRACTPLDTKYIEK